MGIFIRKISVVGFKDNFLKALNEFPKKKDYPKFILYKHMYINIEGILANAKEIMFSKTGNSTK